MVGPWHIPGFRLIQKFGGNIQYYPLDFLKLLHHPSLQGGVEKGEKEGKRVGGEGGGEKVWVGGRGRGRREGRAEDAAGRQPSRMRLPPSFQA